MPKRRNRFGDYSDSDRDSDYFMESDDDFTPKKKEKSKKEAKKDGKKKSKPSPRKKDCKLSGHTDNQKKVKPAGGSDESIIVLDDDSNGSGVGGGEGREGRSSDLYSVSNASALSSPEDKSLVVTLKRITPDRLKSLLEKPKTITQDCVKPLDLNQHTQASKGDKDTDNDNDEGKRSKSKGEKLELARESVGNGEENDPEEENIFDNRKHDNESNTKSKSASTSAAAAAGTTLKASNTKNVTKKCDSNETGNVKTPLANNPSVKKDSSIKPASAQASTPSSGPCTENRKFRETKARKSHVKFNPLQYVEPVKTPEVTRLKVGLSRLNRPKKSLHPLLTRSS